MLREKEKIEIQTYLQLTEFAKDISPRQLLEELFQAYLILEKDYQQLKMNYQQLEMIYQKQSQTLHEKFKELRERG